MYESFLPSLLPHISWNGSEQGRNVWAKASADACPESIRPLRYAVQISRFLVAKKPFFGKVEARPKGTVSFVHSIYHGPTLS